MRLGFSVNGEQIVNTVEVGTLSHKRSVPYREERINKLSREVVEVLARGNRVHTISESNLAQLEAVGQELAGLLLPPETVGWLAESDEPVYLQVDESLVTVPWELLHDGEGFWCQRFDLGRAVATPQTIVGRGGTPPTVGPLRMLVICADPRGDLPQVSREGELLLERFDATDNIDAHLLVDPTVEAVQRALREHDLVHFAGHAEHDPARPERSGWLLADGRLSAEDVVQLSAGKRVPLLVFSNACRSSETDAWRADDDASRIKVYGLANAFLLGGVRHYLGTQWEVVDAQSADFALTFYEALARGASAGTAVRVARAEVIGRHGSSALAWAGYVLYGDPAICPAGQPAPEKTAPPVMPAGQLQARAATVWKRPPPRDSKARRRRQLVPLLVAALLATAGVAVGLYLSQRSSAGPGETDKPSKIETVAPLEPGHPGAALPQVAVLVGDPGGALASCIEEALRAGERFRVVDGKQVAQLARAEGVALDRPQPAETALRLGRGLQAELVLYRGKTPGTLAVSDVLTGETPHRRPLPRADAGDCLTLGDELVRIFHGEGEVLTRSEGLLTVNLGWRSRVAPGSELEVLHGDTAAGRLKVVRVEMDRCQAEGKAQVGDRVRILRE